MKALWIAMDGTKHEIAGKDLRDIRKKIEKLREKLGKEDSPYMHAQPLTDVGKSECAKLPDIEELPDNMRKKLMNSVHEQWNKSDSSNLN
jgi:hypothetical protein